MFSSVDKIASILEDLLSFSVKVRWMEEHGSNYPGCGYFYMLDLDKKVANRVCANTNGGVDTVELDNVKDKENPYIVHIKTGCKNEPRRGERFCGSCMSEFAVEDRKTGDILFLESLHPVKCKSHRVGHCDGNKVVKNPGMGWILVKQFGVKYKF